MKDSQPVQIRIGIEIRRQRVGRLENMDRDVARNAPDGRGHLIGQVRPARGAGQVFHQILPDGFRVGGVVLLQSHGLHALLRENLLEHVPEILFQPSRVKGGGAVVHFPHRVAGALLQALPQDGSVGPQHGAYPGPE